MCLGCLVKMGQKVGVNFDYLGLARMHAYRHMNVDTPEKKESGTQRQKPY